jgi:HK97 family phage major capsid protein
MSNSMIETLKARRKVDKAGLEALSIRIGAAPASEARGMRTKFAAGIEELEATDARIEELEGQDAREGRAAAHRVEMNPRGSGPVFTTNEASPYQDPHEVGASAPSFIRDMRDARMGNREAADRLSLNQQIRASENRAITTVAGSAGAFAPPAWLVSEFINLARPGRVTADRLNKQALPGGASSINLPKVASGTVVGVQQTQNTQIADTSLTSTSVSSGITTIAGQQILSLQLVAQSPIPIDRMVLADLAFSYAQQIDLQVIAGTGANGQLRGLEHGASVGTTAYTTASPAFVSTTSANSFYNALVRAVNAVATTRYLPAEAIIMTPTRWAWCQEALDTATRPLILTGGASFNAPGISTEATAEGAAGSLLNLPVYVDNNVTQTLGAATNQDEVFVLRGSDVFLYESELQMETFDSTFANTNSLLVRALAYSAMIPDRYSASVNIVGGTGLVAPTL